MAIGVGQRCVVRIKITGVELRNAKDIVATVESPQYVAHCQEVSFDEVSGLVYVAVDVNSAGSYSMWLEVRFAEEVVYTPAFVFAEVEGEATPCDAPYIVDVEVAGESVSVTPPKIDVDAVTREEFERLSKDVEGKVDKVEGKGLSTNDFTDEYKQKVDEFSGGGGGGSITIDKELSATSDNAIANSAVTKAINAMPTKDGYYPDMSVGMAENAAVANELDYTISLIGKGMTSVTRKLHLVKGRVYRLSCVTPNWNLPTTSNTGWYKFIFRRWQGDTSQNLLYVKHTEDFPASFTYIASEDADYYDIFLRASDGVEVKFLLEPIEINVENVAFVAGWGGNPTINHTTKTLDLGSEAVFKIGTKHYISSQLACDIHNIPLQDTSGSSVQFLYFNTQEKTIFPKIYTYEPNAEEVLLGGIKFLNDGTIVPNLIFDVEYTGTGSENGIVQLNGESKTLLKLRQLNRQSRDINGNLVGIKPLSLLHFSDIHSREDNLQRIMDFANYYDTYLDDVVCGGDVVGGHWGDDFTFWEGCGANKVLNCIGNHDVAHYSAEEGWDYDRYVGIDAYNRYFAPYISEWGVTQPSDAASAGKCYYYKDYVDSQVRLIVLDCMAIAKGDEEQLTWLTSILESAKQSGLTVAIVYHYTTIHNKIECAFTNLFADTLPTDINSGLIDIVGNYIDGGGKFSAWITGHTHKDWFGTIKGATGKNQTVVCVDTAAAKVQSKFSDIERNESDKSFDLFNIIGIDTYRHRISVFRIGADFDAAQRHIGSICYDYENHKLLANW